MKVLLIRGPRYYWPFINEQDNYLLPQSLVCLAAVLRENGIVVKVIDCMPLKIGWQTLRRIIEEEKPDVVGIGDSESLYSHEAVKVVKLAKEISPSIITVAGGAHFSNLIEESLKNFPIDFIVRGEGEYSFLNLLKELEKENPDFKNIKGISYRIEDKIINNPPQPLIENLDELPLPAYDLMPMSEYGKAKYLFSPGGVTIHHSRGCISNCKFCIWWKQMSERKLINGKEVFFPRWRTKSVEKTIEEIEILYYKYNKKFLIFVDDSFNISLEWNNRFAEELLKKKFKIGWFAFMRADFILRDEEEGVFEKLVKAGLSHVSIGVERATDEELKEVGKKVYKEDITKRCFQLLKKKYPEVFRQATFIVGIRSETRKSLLRQLQYAKEISADYPGFHPLTPVPGTELWEEAVEKGWLEVKDFSQYDWITPVMSSEYLKREEIEELIYFINRKYTRFSWLLKGLFSRSKYKRNMYIWWIIVVLRMFWFNLKRFINPFRAKEYFGLIKPPWYDR